jgi:hypothetical protein
MYGFLPDPTNPEAWRAMYVSQGKDETMVNQPDPRMAEDAQSRETASPGVADATIRSTTTGGSYGESRHTTCVDPTGNQVESQVEVYHFSRRMEYCMESC